MGRNSKSSDCGVCRLLNMLVSLAFLGAGGYVIWHFLGKPDLDDVKDALDNIDSFGDFTDVLGNLTDIDWGRLGDTDPFLSNNDTTQWPTKGTGGLELELVNDLDETWQDEFEEAVWDWDNGTPDALTLTVTSGEVDYECKNHEDGLMRVCSGNFGDTGWLGINEIMQRGDIIQSSVAKMNEYYLRNAGHDKRQYTMCHEIGHGYGLPHTDENFNNPSLGNCLDYTNTPSDNMHPDETNYRRLASLYGTVGSRRRLGRSVAKRAANQPRALSADQQREYEDAMRELEQVPVRDGLENTEWKVLHDHSHGRHLARHLGEELTLVVHVLHNMH